MDIELRHFRVICAIAETGSVTKAAAVLGLAQPALTAKLQRIERAIGGPLFERDRRGARPTPLGELVLARARLVLPAVKSLQADANRLARGEAAMSRYRIGSTNGPIVGGLVHRLAAAHPEAAVSTYTNWSATELTGMVHAGSLDYALVGVCGNATPVGGDELAWHQVCVDAVCVLLAEDHPLAGRAEVALAELADEQWADAPGDGCFNECFAAACARAGFTPRHIFETDTSGCVDLIVAGAAVVLCQGTFRQRPGIAMVPIAGTPLRWRHLLGWLPDGAAAAAVDEVLEHAVATYEDVVSRSPDYVDWLGRHPGFGAGGGVATGGTADRRAARLRAQAGASNAPTS
jgi:DNA-binding transcriptional LysR family regulator